MTRSGLPEYRQPAVSCGVTASSFTSFCFGIATPLSLQKSNQQPVFYYLLSAPHKRTWQAVAADRHPTTAPQNPPRGQPQTKRTSLLDTKKRDRIKYDPAGNIVDVYSISISRTQRTYPTGIPSTTGLLPATTAIWPAEQYQE